jgi:hypothetical protein
MDCNTIDRYKCYNVPYVLTPSRSTSKRSDAASAALTALPLSSSKVPTTESSDVSDISDQQIAMMCDFHYEGLVGKAKVTSIIDSNTVKLLLYINLNDLNCGRITRVGRMSKAHQEIRYPIITNSDPKGYFMILKVKLLGPERSIEEGKALTTKCLELGNVVYYQLFETSVNTGPNVTTSANLYADSNFQLKLN